MIAPVALIRWLIDILRFRYYLETKPGLGCPEAELSVDFCLIDPQYDLSDLVLPLKSKCCCLDEVPGPSASRKLAFGSTLSTCLLSVNLGDNQMIRRREAPWKRDALTTKLF